MTVCTYNASDALAILSVRTMHVFPVTGGHLGQMVSWPAPLGEELPTSLLLLPGFLGKNAWELRALWSPKAQKKEVRSLRLMIL